MKPRNCRWVWETSISCAIVLIFTLMFARFSALASSFQNEPDGFRGIKWGTDISTLKNMKHIKDEENNVKVYIRDGDELTIGAANLARVEYKFWKGNFFFAVAITIDDANWEYLKESCFEKFGKTQRNHGDITEIYKWEGVKSIVGLFKINNKPVGQFFVMSQEIQKQINTEIENKIKKGDGF